MKNLFYFFGLAFLFACCCHNTKPNFIYLDKLSGKRLTNFPQKFDYNEVILVENAPEDKDSAQKITDEYMLNYGKDLCLFDTTIRYYFVRFYRKTRNTSYFIHKAEDPGGFSSYEISDYPEDELSYYLYKRSNQNQKVWVRRPGEDIDDTAKICE